MRWLKSFEEQENKQVRLCEKKGLREGGDNSVCSDKCDDGRAKTDVPKAQ